jgi:ABC-type uncharacterized transport system ATPase subunit
VGILEETRGVYREEHSEGKLVSLGATKANNYKEIQVDMQALHDAVSAELHA